MFFKVSEESIKEVKGILMEFEAISGQQISLNKSEICISSNMDEGLRRMIRDELKVKIVMNHGSYLGMPLIQGRGRRRMFQEIIDKMKNRISSGTSRPLSIAGREVMIKAVLQALPVYVMCCFVLPDGIIKEMQSCILNYWWSSKASGRNMRWVNKETLYADSKDGGLGFRELKSFNLALLAKQGWRLMAFPDSLVSRVMKAKYFPNNDLLISEENRKGSFIWKSFQKAFFVLRKGVEIDQTSGRPLWRFDGSGAFSVKSAYEVLRREEERLAVSVSGQCSSAVNVKLFWRKIWGLPIPRKIKLFVWRAYHNGIPTGDELERRIGCDLQGESAVHLFKDCWWLRAVWTQLGLEESFLDLNFKSFADWIYFLSDKLELERLSQACCAFWMQWYKRNSLRHGKEDVTTQLAIHRINFLVNYSSNIKSIYAVTPFCCELDWKPPPKGVFKFNCDGAWTGPCNRVGIGVVARDEDGCVVAVWSKCEDPVPSSNIAEFCAVMSGMKMALTLGLEEVIFEMDSTTVAECLWFRSNLTCSSSSKSFCIEELLRHKKWQVGLVRREANKAADFAAKRARDSGSSWVKIDACPTWIGPCI